jgi:hypothetical protein
MKFPSANEALFFILRAYFEAWKQVRVQPIPNALLALARERAG